MKYKFIQSNDVMDNIMDTCNFLDLFIKHTKETWTNPSFQDEFRDMYKTYLLDYNGDLPNYENPIDHDDFIISLAEYSTGHWIDYTYYILGYEEDILKEFAILCKIKDSSKQEFEENPILDMDAFYLPDNSISQNIIECVIRTVSKFTNTNEAHLYIDIFLENQKELDLIHKLNFKEVIFESNDSKDIHKKYNIDLSKYKRFKYICNKED